MMRLQVIDEAAETKERLKLIKKDTFIFHRQNYIPGMEQDQASNKDIGPVITEQDLAIKTFDCRERLP